MARFLDRLGRACAHHKWRTIGIWFLVAVALGVSGKAAGGRTVDVFTIPGAQSQQAVDLLGHGASGQGGAIALAVCGEAVPELRSLQRGQRGDLGHDRIDAVVGCLLVEHFLRVELQDAHERLQQLHVDALLIALDAGEGGHADVGLLRYGVE